MESLLDWGIQVVLWFQQFSPTLDLPFKAFTFLGFFVRNLIHSKKNLHKNSSSKPCLTAFLQISLY